VIKPPDQALQLLNPGASVSGSLIGATGTPG